MLHTSSQGHYPFVYTLNVLPYPFMATLQVIGLRASRLGTLVEKIPSFLALSLCAPEVFPVLVIH